MDDRAELSNNSDADVTVVARRNPALPVPPQCARRLGRWCSKGWRACAGSTAALRPLVALHMVECADTQQTGSAAVACGTRSSTRIEDCRNRTAHPPPLAHFPPQSV